MTIKKYLKDYNILSVSLEGRKTIGLTAQIWKDRDAMDLKQTAVFLFFPDNKPDQQWSWKAIGCHQGIDCCGTTIPQGEWVFVTTHSEVLIAGPRLADWEKQIKKDAYIFNVKTNSWRRVCCNAWETIIDLG